MSWIKKAINSGITEALLIAAAIWLITAPREQPNIIHWRQRIGTSVLSDFWTTGTVHVVKAPTNGAVVYETDYGSWVAIPAQYGHKTDFYPK